MGTDELSLELARIRFRLEVHEHLLLQMCLSMHLLWDGAADGLPLSDLAKSLDDGQAHLLKKIEGIGAATEQLYLSSPSSFTPLERAMYAGEIREAVDNMKKYVTGPVRAWQPPRH